MCIIHHVYMHYYVVIVYLAVKRKFFMINSISLKWPKKKCWKIWKWWIWLQWFLDVYHDFKACSSRFNYDLNNFFYMLSFKRICLNIKKVKIRNLKDKFIQTLVEQWTQKKIYIESFSWKKCILTHYCLLSI